MDEADHAIAREQANIDRAIKAAQRNVAETPAPVTGPVYCEDCDNEIPPKRIEAVPSATRCVRCQASAERS